ncbi:MAG: DUF4214 domain-containing protein [Geobacter sp.]|nr:DUF4214 domain-containing protein [Geobacter sp.]
MGTYDSMIQKFYIAFFNRPADVTGMAYWNEQITAAGGNGQAVVNAFSASAEYQALYAGQSNAQIVNSIYQNLFGRAAEADGLTYWTLRLDNGTFNVGNIAYSILVGAQNEDLTTINNKVTVATSFTTAMDTAAEILAYSGTAAAQTARTWLSTVTDDAATVTAAQASVASTVATITNTVVANGTTYNLTAGVDAIIGTASNDTINAAYDATAAAHTLGGLDTINGGGGIDTLAITNSSGAFTMNTVAQISNVENITIRGAAAVTADVSGANVTGLTSIASTQSAAATVTAAATTDVSVSGATGAIIVNGGKNITVSDATAAQNITVGATTVNAGTITVTDTNQSTGGIAVDGGTNVTVTASGVTSGTVTVGDTTAGTIAADIPSGTNTVTSTGAAYVAAATDALGAITVTGGTAITVDQTAFSATTAAAADGAAGVRTQSAVTVTGSTATTSVTVSQDAPVAAVNAVTAVAGNAEAQTVTFVAMAAGETTAINGLTFTAAKALTAAEVAAAFANLTAADTHGCASTANGTYTGTFNTLAFTSGAVTTTATASTVVFTSTTNTGLAALTITDTAAAGNVAVTNTVDGVATVTGVTGVAGIAGGAVVIDDNATTASVTTITVDGYGASSTIGATNATTALASLTLKNTAVPAALAAVSDMVVADTASTLALAVENMGTSTNTEEAIVTFTAAPTTLNVTATGNNYIDLTAAATTTLNVAGAGLLNVADIDLAGLTTVAVTGSASLVLSGSESDTLTSVNTSGTTGAVTASIDGTAATYTGGAGVDTLSLVTGTALTKAIDLGAGDDTVVFTAAVTGSTATLSGGAGTDTVSMSVARADALDASIQTFYTNFERLTLNTAAGTDDATANEVITIDLEKLGLASYVTSNGTVLDSSLGTDSDVLALSNMASGGTLKIVAAAAGANTFHTVAVKDAATGAADSLNVLISTAATLNAGVVTAANVETINVTATDTSTTTANADTLVLTAAAATAVTVAGNASLTLTMTGSTAVTSINASTMTGGLTVTSLNTSAATTITGGAGADSLTAATGTTADVLIGGAGNDTLTINAGLDTLTGGAGNDTFVVATASLNSSSYATITDFAAGDSIKFTGADSFRAAAVTQADTAVFQDYANAAINAIGANDVAWFQYAGNTYIVMDAGADTATFTNSQDYVVKLTGLVDLTNASFNDTADTIQIC